MIRNSLPVYFRGFVAWWVLVKVWPLRWYGNAPRWLFGMAWAYAEDERQHEKARSA